MAMATPYEQARDGALRPAFSVLSFAFGDAAAMRRTLRLFLAALLALAAAGGPLRAEGGRGAHDHEEALSARETGAIMSLPDILAALGPALAGEVLEVEFEMEDGRPLYEFTVVAPDGHVRELYVDARTATVVADDDDDDDHKDDDD